LKNYSGNVEDFDLTFTIDDTIATYHNGQITGPTRIITRELCKNGANIPVTNENRLMYITYVARHRLVTQPYRQTKAFLKGLSSMIQPTWLSMFNQNELQTLLGGASSEIDVEDLRNNTVYMGLYDSDEGQEIITRFWAVIQDFSDAEKRKLLKFVTSTPRAPLLGFKQLNPQFCIRNSGSIGEDDSRLPTASTCVNLLKLPPYPSADLMKEKLLYAINAEAGFDLS
jgi:ubiquitin-protein ligase E3 C